MSDFFEQPILNSPYGRPAQHWELDFTGQPTGQVEPSRRGAKFITPIPKPKKRRGRASQADLVFEGEAEGLSTSSQAYDPTPIINLVRSEVDEWRGLPRAQWGVTPETARLLDHWRNYEFSNLRPFFCQVEAAETVVWLTEVAPKSPAKHAAILNHLKDANEASNPGLERLALKLATGAGKTTVMAMLIAWQTVNAVRRPTSKKFTRGFLVVAPGITIRDRLRVLQPNDPDSYYASRELVPQDMLPDIDRAKIVITNYHSFKLRETLDISKGGRSLLQGRGEALHTLETEGQMIQRVMPELMGMKGILVLNDEAHHCYREKPGESVDEELERDEKKEAQKNKEAARLWITGLETVERRLGLRRVIDLSATPFFLSGSGYVEGTLFPWTMCDFSLMDAIECGIVKLPRVPVADNIVAEDVPVYRDLWKHIGKKMPKKGRGKGKVADPLSIPLELQTALEALYGHYEKTFELWEEEGIGVPPCFIVVCNNTSSSKLVYDYISGFTKQHDDGSESVVEGRLELFRNFDEHLNPLPKPRTLLIDSEQLESGDALDKKFRDMAAEEIERFRREIIERTGDRQKAESISDADLLREVMNTVGKQGRLGGQIRCVVSVSMLTEGWDANTVTHVLGVRAFGTQLLCEQVVGRALRRQSYDLNDEGLFNVEYADVLGIPFDFNAKPVVVKPQPPRETVLVQAISPDRDACEITFPRVEGYRIELPEDRLRATFDADDTLVLTPDLVGPTSTSNEGIIGAGVVLTVEHLRDVRRSTLLFNLTRHLLFEHWRDEDGEPRLHLFGQLKRITREWLDSYLVCHGGTYPAQLIHKQLADQACEIITRAINEAHADERPIRAVLDPYNPEGSTRHVRFTTSKRERWQTHPELCHVNWAVTDSGWEEEFCRIVEQTDRVKAYVKNHGLGFEVPYVMGQEAHRYRPDFIVLVDDGWPEKDGEPDLLHLVIEIKGYRGLDAQVKKSTMDTYWVPGVNRLGSFGRWAFAEFTDPYSFQGELEALITDAVSRTP
jgi:type III restriction enzyme